MDCYIGIEGFSLTNGFIAKELAIVYMTGNYYQYLFKSPEITLSSQERKTIRYVTKHLNGLSYHEGFCNYSELPKILDTVKHLTIYTYGSHAKSFLESYLPSATTIDIQERGFQMPKTLPEGGCPRNHRARYCALAKAKTVKNFVRGKFM